MHGEDLLVNDCSNGQAVEAIRKCLPQLDVVPSLALVVETIDTVDRCAFVVAAQDEEVFWVFNLVREKETDGLERLLSTIDVVSQKQVVSLRRKAAVFKQAQEIIVLAVNVAAYLAAVSSELPCLIMLSQLTFMGASSSRRIGCEMKISRALVHRKRISASSNCTCLPGLLPLTSSKRSMMESKSTSFWSAIACAANQDARITVR